MLEVQKYIKDHGLQKLVDTYHIHVKEHPNKDVPLIILNYNQIKSPKYSEITRECRSLVLEKGSWALVSRAFRRFYNFGENLDDPFNWSNYRIEEKKDGSLLSLFSYRGDWMVRTSGSFAEGQMCAEAPWTWSGLFFNLLPLEKITEIAQNHFKDLESMTLVFELTSIFNKVVATHKEPGLTLLSCFDNVTAKELPKAYSDGIARLLNISRPRLYEFPDIKDGIEWLKTQPSEFEGFVLVDDNKNRIKLKSDAYLALHHLLDNGNIFLTRRLIPLILNKAHEKFEILKGVPELTEKWNLLEGKMGQIFKDADEIWGLYNDYDKKRYAKAIHGEPKYMQSILFTAHKAQQPPSSMKAQFESLLIKYLE